MAYAPEQDRVQDKAGATQYLDQRVWGQFLNDSHPKPALQKKTQSQPRTNVLEIHRQERRYGFSKNRDPGN